MQGDLYDHESLVKAIKQVDVVISTVGHALLADQVKIIAAIKEAGNVKVYQFVSTSFFYVKFEITGGEVGFFLYLLCCFTALIAFFSSQPTYY